jgi:hypothetical protein
MSESAHVSSIDAVKAFREALCTFGVDAQAALCSADTEIRRVVDWVHGQLQVWQRRVRECQEEVTRAKAVLVQRRWGHDGGRGPGSTEAELDLRKAQHRLQEAEAKVQTVRRWIQQLPQALLEYDGHARQLSGWLDSDLRQGLVVLDRKLDALEAYVRLTAGSGPGPEAAESAAPPADAPAAAPPGDAAAPPAGA